MVYVLVPKRLLVLQFPKRPLSMLLGKLHKKKADCLYISCHFALSKDTFCYLDDQLAFVSPVSPHKNSQHAPQAYDKDDLLSPLSIQVRNGYILKDFVSHASADTDLLAWAEGYCSNGDLVKDSFCYYEGYRWDFWQTFCRCLAS